MTRSVIITALSAVLLAASPVFADDHHQPAAGHGEGHAHEHEHEHAHDHDGATPVVDNADIAAALEAGGSLVTADVLGMVCDFCAVAMTRTFGRRDEVAAVHVDLDAKTLQIVVREGQTLTDETIADLVRRSGYELETIRRGEGA